jgi:hypothetical protein
MFALNQTISLIKSIGTFVVNTAIWLAYLPGATLVIHNNLGWYCDVAKVFIRHRQIQIVPWIKVITKLPNSEKSYKGKVQTHNYINRQNQSTTGKLWKP